MRLKGTFHLKDDGKYYVKAWNLSTVRFFVPHNEFELCEDDQEDRKRFLKESMSMEGEEVEFELTKKFLAKETKLVAKLIWKTPQYTLEDIIEAVNYGFNYKDNSQHDREVPVGNTLQWLMARKNLTKIPKDWERYKSI